MLDVSQGIGHLKMPFAISASANPIYFFSAEAAYYLLLF